MYAKRPHNVTTHQEATQFFCPDTFCLSFRRLGSHGCANPGGVAGACPWKCPKWLRTSWTLCLAWPCGRAGRGDVGRYDFRPGKSYWYCYRPFLFMQVAWDLYDPSCARPDRNSQHWSQLDQDHDDCWAAAASLESSDDHWAAAACSHADSAALPPEKNALEDALRMHAANKASQVWRDLHQRGKNDSQADLWLFRIARNILNKFPHHTDPSWRIRFLYIYYIDLFSALLFEHASVSISIAFRVLAKPSMSFSVGAVLSPLLHELWTIRRSCEHIDVQRKYSCCSCANV